MSATTELYRFFGDSGDLLYVGITANLADRLTDHQDKRWWPEVASMTLEPFTSRKAAAEAERAAIGAEAPRYNVVHRLAPRSTVRTVRISDQLWEAAQDTAWGRREKAGPSGPMRLALRAYVADADAFEAVCRTIIGEDS